MSRLLTFVALSVLIAAAVPAAAQAPAKAKTKSAVVSSAARPASAEPATVDEAAKVLDLRTFPRILGSKLGNLHTLGMLMYDARTTPKAAFEFQQKALTKLGFKELPGGYASDETNSSHFTKDGFVVAVSTSPSYGDPAKAGLTSVSLVNSGNVDLAKLPVPPGVKPFHPTPQEASYTTTAKPAETAAACRKLLLAAAWEPYGQTGEDANQPGSSMQYFKKNAIQLQSWISTAQVEGGKTLIRYSTELLSADLPCPTDATDPRYDDSLKTLHMDEPTAKTDAILAFYQERLPKMGWKATTEKPIVDDRTKSQFVVYRNAQKELLSLDLDQFTDIVRVTLKHQTAAELAEEERLAKIEADKQRAAEEKRNKKLTVAIPLPAKAKDLEHKEPNLIEFNLPTGSGQATLEAFREQFKKEGWTQKEADFEKIRGDLRFEKDQYTLDFSYFDIGDVDIRISASNNVILEPAEGKLAASDKPGDKPVGDKPVADAPKKGKKKAPSIPGLPPGVEIPAEVGDLIKKALEEAKPKP